MLSGRGYRYPPLVSKFLLSPLFLCRVKSLRLRYRRFLAMVKDKTAALERAKKATGAAKGKKPSRGSSSRSGLPPGWIQGDWIRSSIGQEDLTDLEESGLIAVGAARLPKGETETQP